MHYPVIPGPPPFINVQPQHIRMQGLPQHQFDGNRQSNQHYVMHSSPEGPQKLKPKNGTSSAFIPLQAARKGVKAKSTVNNDSAKKEENLDNSKEEEPQPVQVNATQILDIQTISIATSQWI